MKKISLVQVNFQQGPTECNSYYLPYSIGCIWAYCQSLEFIQNNYVLNQIVWKRDDICEVAERLKNDAVVAFSTYVWNRQYNLRLSKLVKTLNPKIKIIFGGPELEINNADIFKKYPWIDIIVKNEGELTFAETLKNLDNLITVPGIIINQHNLAVDTGTALRIQDLSVLPSPYLTGFFDQLVAVHPEIEWAASLETNRGCPYQCTFCDWGSLTYNKIQQFSLEKVYAELTWIATNRCGFIFLTDANFGIFVERDNLIIDHLIKLQNRFGFPKSLNTSWAKNQHKEVFEITEKLINQSPGASNYGIQLSLQTMDDNTLDIIKRKNLKINNIREIVSMARSKNVPIGTELILGLPGETLESWKNSMWKVLELELDGATEIYYNQLLENSPQNLVQKDIYNIKTLPVYDYLSSAMDNDGPLAESIPVVYETSTMTYSDWVNASLFNWFIFTFHVGGLSNIIAKFYNRYYNLSYQEFYEWLMLDLAHEPWYQRWKNEILNTVTEWIHKGKLHNLTVSGIKIHGWTINYITRIKIAQSPEMLDLWYKFLSAWLEKKSTESGIRNDVLTLQQHQLVFLNKRFHYPCQLSLTWNIWEYITTSVQLSNTGSVLTLSFPENSKMSDLEFLERIYFSRKRQFGKTWIS